MVKRAGLAVLTLLAGSILGLAGSASATGKATGEVDFNVKVMRYVDMEVTTPRVVDLGSVGFAEYMEINPMPNVPTNIRVRANCGFTLSALADQGQYPLELFVGKKPFQGAPIPYHSGKIFLENVEAGVTGNEDFPYGVSIDGNATDGAGSNFKLEVKPDPIRGKVVVPVTYTATIRLELSAR